MTIPDARNESTTPPMHTNNQNDAIPPMTPRNPINPTNFPSASASASPARWVPWLFWAAAALTCLLVYGRFLFGQIPVGADNTLMYASFFAMRWQGGPPLWNPYCLSGAPLIDNLQAAMLYPLRWPFYFLTDWRAYFGPFVFLHYAIALGGMAGLLRAMGLRRLAVLGGAIVFAIGGHMAGRVINLTIFMAACWLPWLLWGAAGRRGVHVALTALGAVMIFLIGSPHLMFYGMIAYGILFFVWTFYPRWREDRQSVSGHTQLSNSAFQVRRPSGPSRPHSVFAMVFHRVVVLALAFMVASPTLVSGIVRAQRSIRTQTSIESNLADSAAPAEFPAIMLGGTGAQVYPEYIDKCCYIGPVALLLIIWLACRGASWRDRRFLGALLLVGVGVFFALGKYSGVQYILPWLPVVRNLAGVARALVLTAVGLAMLIALALDALSGRRTGRLALVLGLLGGGALLVFWLDADYEGGMAEIKDLPALMFQAWIVAPAALTKPWFPALDAAWGLSAAALILALPPARDRLRLGLLVLVIFALCWHFAPRVFPPTERAPFFDPPPQVAVLQGEQARSAQAPFRVAGYDPLRLHDCEFDNPFKFQFLMPNSATLYRLEDINGFDPLIHLRYLDLFLRTAGRAPYNDPIRNLDLARPDTALFDMLGVRFLVGNPYDRCLTTLPLGLAGQQQAAAVEQWDPARAGGPVTHWLIVSLIDNALKVPLGATVAWLHIEAEEGAFDFPIRNGGETAQISALNYSPLTGNTAFRAMVNMSWQIHAIMPDNDYLYRMANYRAVIPFGRPLHVKRAAWRLAQPGIILNVAAQGYRLAAPPGAPWVLRYGSPDQPAPVYEYTAARPRATLVPLTAAGTELATEIELSTATLNQPPAAGAVEWLARTNGGLSLRVKAAQPSLLVLREIWDPGWNARVDHKVAPVRRVNGLLRGVVVPAGESVVRLAYRPRLPLALLALAGVSLGVYGVGLGLLRRKRPA